MNLNITFDNTNIELTGNQAEEMRQLLNKFKEDNRAKLNPFREPEYGEKVYWLGTNNDIMNDLYTPDMYKSLAERSEKLIEHGSGSVDKDFIMQRRYRRKLNDLLEKFYYDHCDEYPPDSECDYEIVKNCDSASQKPIFPDRGPFVVIWVTIRSITGGVQFQSKDFAQRALDEIVIPFINEHPDFKY